MPEPLFVRPPGPETTPAKTTVPDATSIVVAPVIAMFVLTVNVPKQALGRTAVLRLQELMSAQTGAVRESTKTALSTSLVRRASV